MRSIKQIKNIKGKTVLVRVDFNVPMEGGKVEDDFKIRKALPTILFLRKHNAKIILISHLGADGASLVPVAKVLNKYVRTKFVPQIVGQKITKITSEMKNGEVVLLENLRTNKSEQECNKIFAMNLAKLANIYVNEAFPECHRKVASITLLPKLLPSYAGLQLESEVRNLSRAFKNPKHPFLFILAGAKFSTKIPIIKKYLKLADYVFVGGALANDLLKAEGYEVGQSLTSDSNYGIAKFLKNSKLKLPEDVVVQSANKLRNKNINEINKNENILDLGNKSVRKLAILIKEAKLILWNGPLGRYEDGGAAATKEVLKLVANSKAESIIGGGDTVVLISQMKMEKKFSFVSTGGGATLDFLANGTLPGIKALG